MPFVNKLLTDYLRWVGSLGQVFKDAGLEEVTVDARHEPIPLTKMSSELLCVVCEECASGMPDLLFAEVLRKICERAHVEMGQGTAISKALQVVVGRKPQPQQTGSALHHQGQLARGIPTPPEQKGSHFVAINRFSTLHQF